MSEIAATESEAPNNFLISGESRFTLESRQCSVCTHYLLLIYDKSKFLLGKKA